MTDEHTPHPSPAPTVDPRSVEGIFLSALEKGRGQPRIEFVQAACGDDPELRMRVEALLRAYDDAGSFLQQPAGNWQSPPLSEPAATAFHAVDQHGLPQGLLRPSDSPECLGAIGPYQVQQVLGRGGMGVVMRALDPKLNRVVAIKVLAPELTAHPAARRRFLREARAAAAVTHPHVIAIYEVNTVAETDWPYLVMEYIAGPSLQDKIDRAGPLPLPEVLRIGTQIAEGLAAAHKQGLVHLDIKPANILLENGVERVKITDFGLARGPDDATITSPGEISGTPQYMSPEQASGERTDQRSDLFSLGCVLYAMCAGHSPFRAKGLAATVKRICEDDPRPLREFDAQFPEWLAAVIGRLLAKDPTERIQTAEEVARVLGGALAQVQAGRPVEVTVAPSGKRAAVGQPHPPAQRPANWHSQPWKIVGWMVVAMLVCFLVLPVLICIGILVPTYQARQSRNDVRSFQASAARLTLNFDEDLRIIDILIDGSSSGLVEISPIDRMVAPGAHTLTVVYQHQDHKRSVRETIEVQPNEQRAVDLTPLVQADIAARAKKAVTAEPNEEKPDPTEKPAEPDENSLTEERKC